VGVPVSGLSAGHRGTAQGELAERYPLDSPQVLGSVNDLASLADKREDFHARPALKMDVAGKPDVVAPAVFRRSETAQNVWRIVAIEEGYRGYRVLLGIFEVFFRELFSNQRSNRLRSAPRVSLPDPTIEYFEKFRFERNPGADHPMSHGSGDPKVPPRSGGVGGWGGSGPTLICSYLLIR
jgi:hypothetical protein